MNTFLAPGLIFLLLVQTVIVPVNFAFAVLLGIKLFNENFSILGWLLLLCIVFSLFSNQNFGLVLAVFAFSFLILEFVLRFLPQNNLTKWLLIGFSLVVCELSFVVFVNLLQ